MLFEFACGSETELVTHANAKRIREDFFGGVRSGLIGTPAFFINGVRHDGAYDYEPLPAAFKAGLTGVAASA